MLFSFKSLVRFLLIATIIFTGAALSRAQDSDQVQIIRINTSNFPQLEVVVSVLDSTGKPAVGLTAKDFVVFEDGKQQPLKSADGVTDENIPLAAVLVIDTSQSMDTAPLADAKAAASTFVDQLRDIDEFALVAFSSTVKEAQPITKDKAAIKAKISALQSGGETALYDAIAQAVKTAQSATAKRRAIVLLTDGDEYGGNSKTGATEAYQLANKAGIPIFTIGLGFGINTSYLQEVAKNTGGQYYPSPKPTDLAKVYTNLATLLRSQYVLTTSTDSPPNGSTHTWRVQVVGANGATSADFTIRYPAPIPIVSISGIDPNTPIDKPATATGIVIADNSIATYQWQIDGKPAATGTDLPKPLVIEPLKLPPGKHTLTLSVTDKLSHTGMGSLDFQVAPLPPEFTIDGLKPNETINADRTITLTVTDSQTPTGAATFSIDGVPFGTVDKPPYSFTLEVLKLAPGKHTLVVQLKNDTSTGTKTLDFNVAPGPRETATANAIVQATTSARETLTALPSSTPTPSSSPTATTTPKPSLTPIPPSGTPAPPSDTATITLSPVPPTDTTTPVPPTNTNTPQPTSTFTNTPLPTNTFTPTASDTPLPTSTLTFTPSNTPTPSDTPTPTNTSTPLPTATPTVTPTSTPVPPLTALTNVASSPIGLLCIGLLLLVLLVILPLLFSGRRTRR